MEWLWGLLLGLALITLIGHGIWVAIARLFRGRRSPSFERCPGCGRQSLLHGRCHVCGWPPAPNSFDPLDVTEEQARLLRDDDLLSADAFEGLVRAITVRRERARADASTNAAPVLPPLAHPFDPTARSDVGEDREALAASSLASASTPPPLPPLAPVDELAPKLPRAADIPDAPTLVPSRPRKPRRPLSDVFAAFMEDRNIRWGELLGGLLIVGCSVALLVSFWSQIAQHPLLKFTIFTGVTAALFALGLYTEHRWKLPTTSRGVLLIAALLVPLNFAAFTALSHGPPTAFGLIGQVLAFALFLWLVWHAAKVIAPVWPALLTAGVMGLSAMSLVIRYAMPEGGMPLHSPPGTHLLFGLTLLTLGAYAAPMGVMLVRARRWKRVRVSSGNTIFLLLGVLSFAAALPLGLLLADSGDAALAARRLAPLLSLVGLPALAAGFLVWRRTSPRLPRLRLAGTVVALIGAAVPVAGLALSWPDPGTVLLVAAGNFLLLTTLAWLLDLPVAHALALPLLVIAYLFGFHLAAGHVRWVGDPASTFRALLLPSGGTALVALVVAMAYAAIIASRLAARRATDGASLLLHAGANRLAALATAVLSIAIVSWGGFGKRADPAGAAYVYGAYGFASLSLAFRWSRRDLAWAGWTLLLAAIAQLFLTHGHVRDPWPTALLTFASLATAAAWGLRGRDEGAVSTVGDPAVRSALAASAVTAALLLLSLSFERASRSTVGAFWLAGIFLALALLAASPLVFAAGQGALALSAMLAAVSWATRQPWFVHSVTGLVDPRALQAIATAAAITCLLWGVLRIVLRPRDGGIGPSLRQRLVFLLDSQWTLDRVVGIGALGVLLALAAVAAAGGIRAEFAPYLRSTPTLPAAWQHAAAGIGSWLLLGVLLLAFALWSFHRRSTPALVALMLTAWSACPLWAARFAQDRAGASALRWSVAGFAVIVSAALAWSRYRARIDEGDDALRRRKHFSAARATLVVVCGLPVFWISLYAAMRRINGWPFDGPLPGRFFAVLNPFVSYALPMALLGMVLTLDAAAGRSARRAFVAGAILSLAVACGYLLAAADPSTGLTTFMGVTLVQLLAITSSIFGLLWFGAKRRLVPSGSQDAPAEPALSAQLWLGAVFLSLVLIPTAVELFHSPWSPPGVASEIASPSGWIAGLLSAVAAGVAVHGTRLQRLMHATALAALVVTLLECFTLARWQTLPWIAYHGLEAGLTLSAWLMLALGWLMAMKPLDTAAQYAESQLAPTSTSAPMISTEPANEAAPHEPAAPPVLAYRSEAQDARDHELQRRRFIAAWPTRSTGVRWASVFGMLAALVALRGCFGDPTALQCSTTALLCIAVLTTAIACIDLSPRYLYASALLTNLAATAAWLLGPRSAFSSASNLLYVNVAALAFPGVAWLVLDLKWFRPRALIVHRRKLPAMHEVAAVGALTGLGLAALFGLMARASRGSPLLNDWIVLAAIGAAAALTLARFWDERARWAPAQLYVLGLVTIAILLERWDLTPNQIAWVGAIAAGAYSLLTSWLHDLLRRLASRLKVADPPAGRLSPLALANIGLGGVTIALAWWTLLNSLHFDLRLTAALALLFHVAGVGILALRDRGRDGEPDRALPRIAIAFAIVAAVFVTWSLIHPSDPNAWRSRNVAAATVLMVIGAVLAVTRDPLQPTLGRWFAAARSMAPIVLLVACGCLAGALANELLQAPRNRVAMPPVYIAAVALDLLIGASLAMVFALGNAGGQLGMPARGRVTCVYVAEVFLALTILHLRVTVPQWFGGPFARYWPLIVMAIAFAGVGLGELLRRRNVAVVGDPLFRTGLLLPLLPVLAFGLLHSRVHYSALLLSVMLLYGVLAVWRRSFGFGLLAALAGNGSLWYLLHRASGFGFFAHPQFWLVPAGLSILIAAQLNRDVLSAERLRAIRYAALTLIYLSSTADIFLNGVRLSPWLPLLLAALSVAGVLAGVMLRIRPFLFLGTAFLALAVLTMIWYASAELRWTWIWYVAGIGLGLAILTLFAMFEKKRSEMTAIMDRLKAWQ